MVTALRCCNVRFEERAREFIFVARLKKVAEAKASVKARTRDLQSLITQVVDSESLTVTRVRPEAR